MDAELERVSGILAKAVFPEDVFGDLSGTSEEMLTSARSVHRRLARIVHPDRYTEEVDRIRAEESFKLLEPLYTQAQEKIRTGTYGDRKTAVTTTSVVIKTRKFEFVVDEPIASGDVSDVYYCTYNEGSAHGILKVARDARDNDLVKNEVRILRHLAAADPSVFSPLQPYVSQLVETFSYREGTTSEVRQAVVLNSIGGLYTLEEVRKRYPKGIDPKDMAWMFGRLLFALELAHQNGVVHGAVLPSHILIHPEQHGLVLVDWSYAVLKPAESGERIAAISSKYKEWYPPEVLAKESPLPGLDLYMGAACMIYLLGGDPITQTFPLDTPRQIHAFLKGCMLSHPSMRPQDAFGLRQEFQGVLEDLWGGRRFHEFTMNLAGVV